MGKKRRGEDHWRSNSEIRHKFLQNGSSSSRMSPEEIPQEASLENILQQMVHVLSMNTEILSQMQDKDDKFRKTEEKLVDMEEKYEKKVKEMEEELEKQNNECKVMKKELEELKDNAVLRSSGYSSPAQRTQPDQSQQPRFKLKILSEVEKIIYKGKSIRTTNTMHFIKVQLLDHGTPISHDHALSSAEVELFILKADFKEGGQNWSEDDFMKGLKRNGEGNTLMQIKNSTFKLISGAHCQPGVIILDNSNRKEVKLGVKFVGYYKERVLEGISNLFKVQEAKTDPNKDDITTDNGQQQQAPTNNMSQHTIARSASENDEILFPNGQQQQFPMNNRSQHTTTRSPSGNGNILAANCQQQNYLPATMNDWPLPTIAQSAEHGDSRQNLQPNSMSGPLVSSHTAITHSGQGRQSFPLATETNSVQPSLYQFTGNGQIPSGDSRQNLQPNSMDVMLASTSHTAVTHIDNLSLPPLTTGRGEFLQMPQEFSRLHNIYPLGNSQAILVGNGIPVLPGFCTQSTSQKDGPVEYAADSHPQTQSQLIPNLEPGNGGAIILNRVQLLWDEPDVEPPRCWNILDKLMPLRLLASDYFLKTMMRVHGTVGVANRSMQRRYNRGVLIQSIEDSDSEYEPPLKMKRQASYQLRFVNKACREYYIWEQIKAEEGGLLKVALYNENSLRITSGPLSSASVEIVLLHGDFNSAGQDYWSPDEFGNYLLCPLSEEERPALAGDCVLTLVDGEGSLSSASFQKTSSFARTGKFKMGVKIKTTLEERVQEGITEPFSVLSYQDEGSNYTCRPSNEGDEGNICTTSAAELLTPGVQACRAANDPVPTGSIEARCVNMGLFNNTHAPITVTRGPSTLMSVTTNIGSVTTVGAGRVILRSVTRSANSGLAGSVEVHSAPGPPLLQLNQAAMSGSYSSRLRGGGAGGGLDATTVVAALAAATSLAGVAVLQLVSVSDSFRWKLYLFVTVHVIIVVIWKLSDNKQFHAQQHMDLWAPTPHHPAPPLLNEEVVLSAMKSKAEFAPAARAEEYRVPLPVSRPHIEVAASPVDEGVVSPGSCGGELCVTTESEEDASSSAVLSRSVAPALVRESAMVERGFSLPPPFDGAYHDDANGDDDLDATWNAIMQKTRPATAPALSSSSL